MTAVFYPLIVWWAAPEVSKSSQLLLSNRGCIQVLGDGCWHFESSIQLMMKTMFNVVAASKLPVLFCIFCHQTFILKWICSKQLLVLHIKWKKLFSGWHVSIFYTLIAKMTLFCWNTVLWPLTGLCNLYEESFAHFSLSSVGCLMGYLYVQPISIPLTPSQRDQDLCIVSAQDFLCKALQVLDGLLVFCCHLAGSRSALIFFAEVFTFPSTHPLIDCKIYGAFSYGELPSSCRGKTFSNH